MNKNQVVNCTMDKNLASWGGAMEFKESIFKCTDSSITRNHATFDGGALNCQVCMCCGDVCVCA